MSRRRYRRPLGRKWPNDKIARWLGTGELVQLRKGLEFALSAHGLIPEGVATLTSVTTRRSRQVNTPLGIFSYTHLPLPLYGQDVRMESNPDGTRYLMASPTQALCDQIVLTRHLQANSVKTMRHFLLEDMRIESESVGALEQSVIQKCIAAGYKTRQLQALLGCVRAMS